MNPCLNCGEPSREHGEFCSHACNKAWHNRRASRGAAMYDLVMALRYDRETATRLGVWKALTRLAAAYRDEDVRQRASRRSWMHPDHVFTAKPWLRNLVVIPARALRAPAKKAL